MNGRKAVENQLRNRACKNKSKKYLRRLWNKSILYLHGKDVEKCQGRIWNGKII